MHDCELLPEGGILHGEIESCFEKRKKSVDDGCQNAVLHVRIADDHGHIQGPRPVEVEMLNFLQSKAIQFWRGTAC